MVNKCHGRLQTMLPTPCCLLCGGPASDASQLCTSCLRDLPWTGMACMLCGKTLSFNSICGECLRKAPIFSQTIVPLRYAYPVDFLIQRLKFSRQLDIARTLAQLLAGAVGRQALPQCIVPVPMHEGRLRQRGFNQATEIARHLGSKFGIPLDQAICHRVAPTPPQSSLTARARRRNVRGAFVVKRMPAGVNHVAIVDDVVTTGATVEEVAKILRKAGVGRIEVWACARTESRGSRR